MFEEFDHFFQEASSKTKITREKNKIKNDLNVGKDGYGKIIDKSTGKETLVKVEFDYNKPTHVDKRKYDSSKQCFYLPMNINPNDIDKGHGFTKYLHEKNHVLQDLRKTRDIIKAQDNKTKYEIKYTRDNDIDDEKLAKAFIDKHRNEIISKHSQDPEEYLADLHTARKRGFNETIRTLDDLMYKPSKNMSKSAKNALSLLKKDISDKYSKEFDDNKIKQMMNTYKQILEEHKSKLKFYKSMPTEANPYDENHEKEIIETMEKHVSSFSTFRKAVVDGLIIKEYEQLREQYDSDLKLRIQFLRDMKKLDKKNGIIHEGTILRYDNSNTYFDPINNLINKEQFKLYQESYQYMQYICNNIKYNIENLISEYSISDDIANDTLNHIILEYLEQETTFPITKELSDTPESVECLMSLSNIPVMYDDTPATEWHLKSPEQLLSIKRGNCHDTAWYIYNKLDEFADHPVNKGLLFFIETDGEHGGVTHSICYEVIPDGFVQIEYSWESFRGTCPRINMDEMIDSVKRNWKFSEGFNQLLWFDVKNINAIHSGMTLQEYVEVCTTDAISTNQDIENIQESKLLTKERDKLNDSDFGIPETRSYPLTDEDHVEAAVRMFPHAPLKYRKALAKRILNKAKELGMDTTGWKSLERYI